MKDKQFNIEQLDRIIEMAWEDRTPFDAILFQFGIKEQEVIRSCETTSNPLVFGSGALVYKAERLSTVSKEVRMSIDLNAAVNGELATIKFRNDRDYIGVYTRLILAPMACSLSTMRSYPRSICSIL